MPLKQNLYLEIMEYEIKNRNEEEAKFISDKLLEFNLSKMPPNRKEEEDFTG